MGDFSIHILVNRDLHGRRNFSFSEVHLLLRHDRTTFRESCCLHFNESLDPHNPTSNADDLDASSPICG